MEDRQSLIPHIEAGDVELLEAAGVEEQFADRINPQKYNYSPKLTAIVGAIIGHDYGIRDRKGGYLSSLSITSDGYVLARSTASDGGGAFLGSASDLDRNLDDYITNLTAEDRAEFTRLRKEKIQDWR